MASAEREPITGVWGYSPQRDPGAEPLVGGQGGKPPEAESFLHRESKKGATLTMAITLSSLDRFAKFFHCCKEH